MPARRPSQRAAAAAVATAVAAALVASPTAAALPSAAGALNVTTLVHATNPRTWYGDVSVAMLGPADPVLLLSSWVYKPSLVEAFRPSHNATRPVWATNVSSDYTYETLYVATAVPYGGSGGPAPPAVDTLLLWSYKPQPMVGPLRLFGVNSAVRPNLETLEGVAWSLELSSTAMNVNLWTDSSWFELSDDGAVAVAWALDSLGASTVWGIDAVHGKVAWNTTISVNASEADYAYSYGVALSADGRWAIYDAGVVGVTNQTLYIVDSATGVLRGGAPPVQSVGLINGVISHDGGYTIANMDPTQPELTVFAWSPAGAGGYAPVASVTGPNPSGSTGGGQGWYLVSASFGYDPPSGRTILGAVWLTADLSGTYAIGVWDVAALASGPIASVNYTAVQSTMAVDEAEISCAGLLCAVAMNTPVSDASMPTIWVLSAEGDGATWSANTPGSMLSVDVNVGLGAAGARTYYVGVAGCATESVCTKPGADAYLLRVSGAQ